MVAGTHAVERAGRRAGVYEALGWPQAPRSGMVTMMRVLRPPG